MTRRASLFQAAGRRMELGRRTLVMGVINVTPDSFSDGGDHLDSAVAVRSGLAMAKDGADILDVGGESTRPGSLPVSLEEELTRVLPVIRGLREGTEALISIDTTKAEVARQAMEAGAHIINDVTAFTADPQMAGVAAATGAGVILMHMKGVPRTMQVDPHYDDVVAEVRDYLVERARAVREAGVAPECIVLDPGIGFGKTLRHNLLLIRHLDVLREAGYPVLLGASRKSFIGTITGRESKERLFGTIGVHVAGAMLGADIVRVHDVRPVVEAILMTDAIQNAGEA